MCGRRNYSSTSHLNTSIPSISPLALRLVVSFSDGREISPQPILEIYYNNLIKIDDDSFATGPNATHSREGWQSIVRSFVSKYNINDNDEKELILHVQEKLVELGYITDDENKEDEEETNYISGSKASYKLLTNNNDNFWVDLIMNKRIFFPIGSSSSMSLFSASYHHSTQQRYHDSVITHTSSIHQLFKQSQKFRQSKSILHRLNGNQRIVFYQTRGANTGGTIALELLYERVRALGYEVLLCNDNNYIHCKNNSDWRRDIAVSGEWCNEVLMDFDVKAGHLLRGSRGIQYHLGFHHARDTCRGHVVVADSHYLSVTNLANQVFGAYYLGCAMTPHIEQALEDMLLNKTMTIRKENLIVFDVDIMYDYPPENIDILGSVLIPNGWKVVFAKNIPRDQMPLILQRAKIVVDLAMPGPERLLGEGILMGAIPVASSRWNGVSSVDFPFLRKCDHLNATDITGTIAEVANNYDSLLNDVQYHQFYHYILSMWDRIHSQTDLYFSSSRLHFILRAKTLSEEYIAIFQIIGLLFLFPLASIDLYISDVLWFMRHHYSFITQLKDGGYFRIDPLDPREYEGWRGETDGDNDVARGFVKISPLSSFPSNKIQSSSTVSADGNSNPGQKEEFLFRRPPWQPLSIFLPLGQLFVDPFELLDLIASAFISISDENNTSDHVDYNSADLLQNIVIVKGERELIHLVGPKASDADCLALALHSFQNRDRLWDGRDKGKSTVLSNCKNGGNIVISNFTIIDSNYNNDNDNDNDNYNYNYNDYDGERKIKIIRMKNVCVLLNGNKKLRSDGGFDISSGNGNGNGNGNRGNDNRDNGNESAPLLLDQVVNSMQWLKLKHTLLHLHDFKEMC